MNVTTQNKLMVNIGFKRRKLGPRFAAKIWMSGRCQIYRLNEINPSQRNGVQEKIRTSHKPG